MDETIFTQISGAVTSKIFGCSLKNITSQMGFNGQPIVFTVTVIQETDQDFTLAENDVRSAQLIEFGSLSLLGIVQSWENVMTDVAGTGVYSVRLTDCRTVLDSANLTNIYVDQPEIEAILVDTNVVYIGPLSSSGSPDVDCVAKENGTLFSTIIDRVEASTLVYGNDVYEVDMTALKDLTNFSGEGINQYFFTGEVRSLVSTITEFCNAVGADWWVESERKSSTDDTIVIAIRIVRRITGIVNSNILGLEELAALHSGNVIRRIEGFENNDIITNKVIWGGIKDELKLFGSSRLQQFWGFDSSGVPLSSPSYPTKDETNCAVRRVGTDVSEMEDVLNGDLDDKMDKTDLASLKRYMNNFWGKKFYIQLNKNELSESGKDLPNFPELVSAGWWEGVSHPLVNTLCDPNTLIRMTTDGGKWGAFVELSEIFGGSNKVTWAPLVENSNNLIQRDGKSFMKCTVQQECRYLIITLPIALTRLDLDSGGRTANEDRLTRQDKISQAWIPLRDRGIRYGPWNTTAPNIRSSLLGKGRSDLSVDNNLVPWIFGIRGNLNSTAQELLRVIAERKTSVLPNLSIINTGQLEVAGIPSINIGESVGTGSSITEIVVRFGVNGITTRYMMNLFTRELGEFKRQEPNNDTIPREEEIFDVSPEPETGDDLRGPTGVDRDFVFERPEGGLGIITFASSITPTYTVKRLNLASVLTGGFSNSILSATWLEEEWTNVRNLSELDLRPALLPVGTRVTVSIFSLTDESGPYIPFIEQAPQLFAPPQA